LHELCSISPSSHRRQKSEKPQATKATNATKVKKPRSHRAQEAKRCQKQRKAPKPRSPRQKLTNPEAKSPNSSHRPENQTKHHPEKQHYIHNKNTYTHNDSNTTVQSAKYRFQLQNAANREENCPCPWENSLHPFMGIYRDSANNYRVYQGNEGFEP